jgi:hypothetical protein
MHRYYLFLYLNKYLIIEPYEKEYKHILSNNTIEMRYNPVEEKIYEKE